MVFFVDKYINQNHIMTPWLSFGIALIFSVQLFFAQEKILEFSTDYGQTEINMENSFTLVNKRDHSFTVFLTQRSKVKAFHFNNEMVNEGHIYSSLLPSKYKVPLGGTIDKKSYTLFFTNKAKSKFAAANFDFNTSLAKTLNIDLKLDNEKLISNFNHNGNFYLATVSFKENHINLYRFDSFGTYEKKIIDLSDHKTYRTATYPVSLYKTLSADMPSKPIYNVQWIQKDVPYSLESMTTFYKLYLVGDVMHLTADINPNFTQLISFNLASGETQLKQFNQPEFKADETMSNSFLSNNTLYQFRINAKEMALSISDLHTGKVLKEHRINKKENLYLASGPIRQRGGRYKKYRELEKTSQFLRKVGSGFPSIFVDTIDGTQKVVLGSVDKIEDGAIQALTFMNPFTAVASFGIVTLYVNPVALAMIKASDTKAVYISSYLDDKFETTQITEKDDIFYRVADFLKNEKTKRYTAVDIFQYKDYFLFGMLDKKNKLYSLRKFEK